MRVIYLPHSSSIEPFPSFPVGFKQRHRSVLPIDDDVVCHGYVHSRDSGLWLKRGLYHVRTLVVYHPLNHRLLVPMHQGMDKTRIADIGRNSNHLPIHL